MSTKKGFGALKRKVYLAYHQDGILDLVAGSVVLGFGINMMADNIVFLMFGWMVMLFYIPLKQRITVPRFGYVQFESREKALTQNLILLGIGVLVVFVIFAGNLFVRNQPTSLEIQAWVQRYHMVPLSAMLFGLPALVVAAFLGLKRFYLYALLAAGLPALGAWKNIETYIPILATGLVMLAFGIGLLAIFMKKHPVADEGGNDVSR